MQGGDVIDGEEGVIVFAEADVLADEFLLDEGVTVEVIGGLERKEGSDAKHIGPRV